MTEKQILKKRQDILKKIFEKMESLKMDENAMAEKTGFKKPNIYRMRSAKYPPTLDNLIRLAAAVELEVSVY